ncbi:MAG: hypothetical protein ICV75_02005 [Nitrospiraceae bacterium]|nr:hypothetical protein [Nitrospiraceae bacterium]
MTSQKTNSLIVAVCCVCDQVAEDGSQPQNRWTNLETYLHDHGIAGADFQLSHTYCPSCYADQALAWQLPPRAA